MEDSPNTHMEDKDTGVSAGYNWGSKYCKVKRIDQLNAQLNEQERLANTAQAYAALLQVPMAGNKQYDTPVPLDNSPIVFDTRRAEPASITSTPYGVFWQSNLFFESRNAM
jgi:hypothetical protein